MNENDEPKDGEIEIELNEGPSGGNDSGKLDEVEVVLVEKENE